MGDLFTNIKNYSDVCRELCEPELTETTFHRIPMRYRKKVLAYSKLQQIQRLFNGEWVPNWSDSSEYKWYPYYNSTGPGLVFDGSGYRTSDFAAEVAFYKSREISDFVGRTFIDIYTELSK